MGLESILFMNSEASSPDGTSVTAGTEGAGTFTVYERVLRDLVKGDTNRRVMQVQMVSAVISVAHIRQVV